MSDEVSDFLRSVELLKERREEEDEARSRELEEKILQEKKERQARRAERARSISPQKSSPANTPPPAAHRIGILPSAADGTSLDSPGPESSGSPRQRAQEPPPESMDGATDYSSSPSKENDSPFDSDIKRSSVTLASSSVGMPSARSPLSWQRRPTSQASDRPKSRPLSMVAAENAARNSPALAESMPAAEQTMSRDQIAQSLAGKDPSWFRQTADPGRGSAAFRRNQVEDSDTVDMPSMRTQLPGLSRELRTEAQDESTAARPVTPTAQINKLGSPLPLTGSQRLDPPVGDGADDTDAPSVNRQSLTSPPGRTSPTRPLSPTKGMGGFVQSAMMKRSDSVKRWSVNSPAGLQRADSVRSSVGTVDNVPRPTTPKSSARPKSMLREASEPLAPVPASSDEKEVEKEHRSPPAEAQPQHENGNTTPPTSPSKTMDPRRWSPTKSSSWLESALNKPESPKAKPTPPSAAQPAWMVELNKAKAQKATADLARSASLPKKPEVKTGGLLRSTPMGASLKPSALSGFPSVPAVPATDKPAVAGLRGSLRRSSPTAESSTESQADPDTAVKEKPETAPKKDFRANLKPRVPPPGAQASGPPDELKNVFGSLRRTKTQNYVAPDDLKDNILRGKAGLNLTGGPKKTERKDEFKEAILKKKEDFKKAQLDGRSVTREPRSASDKALPEGIAKKLELQRTGTVSKQTPTTPEFPLQSPELAKSNRSSHISTSSRHDLPGVNAGTVSKSAPEFNTEPAANPLATPAVPKPADGPKVQARAGGLADRFNPALASFIARGPPPASGPSKSTGSASAVGGKAESEEPASGPQLTHLTKNRARGPRRKAPTSAVAPADGRNEQAIEAVAETDKKPVMTPRPQKSASLPQPEPVATSEPEPKPALTPKPQMAASFPQPEPTAFPSRPGKPIVSPKPEKFAPPNPEMVSLADSKKPSVGDKPKALGDVISLVDSSKRMSKEAAPSVGQPITLVGSSPVKTRPRSPTKVHEQVAALAALSQQSPKAAEPSGEASQPSSPKKLDMKRMSRFMDEQGPASPKSEPVTSRPSSPVKDRFVAPAAAPTEKQTGNSQNELKAALPIRSEAPPRAVVGLGLTHAVAPKPAAERPTDAQMAPQAPAQQHRRLPSTPSITSPRATSPRISSPLRSPGKPPADVSALITDFFGPDRPRRKYTADAADILTRRPASTAKIQTQRAQLVRLTAEGKKVPVPSHNERVLFEREMYLCPHTYLDAAGRKVSEVYFWAGDEVPAAEVEDAQLFAAREARALGGRVVRLAQGRESSEFVQALGGIVMVRRGSSNKYDSLAPNMLCGRRYLGQVAFDEVDFSPLSLCSGFPYLIAQQGRCYLWKGKGSDVEELGCARLVGMDLALMGELIEVDEGAEPDSFWDIFGAGGGGAIARPSSADHWRLKPHYDRYCGRLFVVNAADKQQITEMSPFTQHDLSPSNIYVLDAFFELYIIVGARSQHQYAAFATALDFAQEYAILAAGMEDRPFVPISTVVLEGIPRDLKSVFRKWRDSASPTVMHVSSQPHGGSGVGAGAGAQPPSPLKRSRSLRIVPLTQALQALAD